MYCVSWPAKKTTFLSLFVLEYISKTSTFLFLSWINTFTSFCLYTGISTNNKGHNMNTLAHLFAIWYFYVGIFIFQTFYEHLQIKGFFIFTFDVWNRSMHTRNCSLLWVSVNWFDTKRVSSFKTESLRMISKHDTVGKHLWEQQQHRPGVNGTCPRILWQTASTLFCKRLVPAGRRCLSGWQLPTTPGGSDSCSGEVQETKYEPGWLRSAEL